MKYEALVIGFKGLPVIGNCLRPKSAPLIFPLIFFTPTAQKKNSFTEKMCE